MKRQGLQAYQNSQYLTASSGQLLVSMYDGAIRYAMAAREAIVHGNAAAKGQHLNRVFAIISELKATMNKQHAPELCANLERMYDHWMLRLQVAGLRMDVSPVDEVLGHLSNLRDAWAGAVQTAGQSNG